MDRIAQIQKIMQDLRTRSGKNYGVQIEKGRAQLVVLIKEGKKTVVTPVTEWVAGSEIYAIADRTER